MQNISLLEIHKARTNEVFMSSAHGNSFTKMKLKFLETTPLRAILRRVIIADCYIYASGPRKKNSLNFFKENREK